MTSPPAAERGPVTLADLLAAMIASWRLAGRKSFSDLERRWRSVLSHFGADAAADSLDFGNLTAYATKRIEAGAAPSTVQKELFYLRRGYVIAGRSGKVSTPSFPSIKVENARQEFIEDDEFFAIEQELPEDLRPFFRFKWLTGWRNAEVAGLTWEKNVDWVRGKVVLLLYTTKNRDAREFPFRFLPSLEALLREQKERTDAIERRLGREIETVFWRNSFKCRGGVPVQNFGDAWHNACKRAGVPGKRPHDFRRTAIRRLELAGVPRSAAMKLVGHKTERAYTRYAIAPPQDLLDGVKRLAGFMGEGAPEPAPAVKRPRPAPSATPFDSELGEFLNSWWRAHAEDNVDTWDLARLRGWRTKIRTALRLLRDRAFTLEGGTRVTLRLVRPTEPGYRPTRTAYRLERAPLDTEPAQAKNEAADEEWAGWL